MVLDDPRLGVGPLPPRGVMFNEDIADGSEGELSADGRECGAGRYGKEKREDTYGRVVTWVSGSLAGRHLSKRGYYRLYPPGRHNPGSLLFHHRPKSPSIRIPSLCSKATIGCTFCSSTRLVGGWSMGD